MLLTPLPPVTKCQTFSYPSSPSCVTYFMDGPLGELYLSAFAFDHTVYKVDTRYSLLPKHQELILNQFYSWQNRSMNYIHRYCGQRFTVIHHNGNIHIALVSGI